MYRSRISSARKTNPSSRRAGFIGVLATLLTFGAAMACSQDPGDGTMSGAGGGGGGGGYNMACVQAALAASCAVTVCHKPDPDFGLAAAAGLDLSSPTVDTDLINRPATYMDVVTNPTLCPTTAPELLVNKANPAASLLLTKMAGGHACGDSMPSAMVAITAEHRLCLLDWANYLATQP